MAAGRLRERVVIEQPNRVDDGAGGASLTWSVLASTWAEIASLGGGEALRGERLEARGTYRVTIRHRDGLTPQMRLLWRGKVLDIRGMRDPDGRRRWLVMNVEEGTA